MRKLLLIILFIALIALLGCTKAPVACTEEAKLCPYGEAVGRIGPNCEFAPCADKCTSDDQCKLIYNSCFCEAVPIGDQRNELPLDPEVRCIKMNDCNTPGMMKAVCSQGSCEVKRAVALACVEEGKRLSKADNGMYEEPCCEGLMPDETTMTCIKADCATDADCVPKESCHPTTCTAKGNEDKDEVACTTYCAPNTLDCGQGSCVCQNGKCNAVMNGAGI